MTHYDTIRLFAKTLQNLEKWMEKAAAHETPLEQELDRVEQARIVRGPELQWITDDDRSDCARVHAPIRRGGNRGTAQAACGGGKAALDGRHESSRLLM